MALNRARISGIPCSFIIGDRYDGSGSEWRYADRIQVKWVVVSNQRIAQVDDTTRSAPGVINLRRASKCCGTVEGVTVVIVDRVDRTLFVEPRERVPTELVGPCFFKVFEIVFQIRRGPNIVRLTEGIGVVDL